MEEELKYFFSYAREDSEFVLRVAKELRAAGANLWLDQLDIVGGQRWDNAVEKALKICQGLIVVLSPESLASDNVMDEVSYALEKGKMVLPIVFRPCDIPFRLRRVQHIDFTANYETGFSQLLRAMRLEQSLQPIKPTAPEAPVVWDNTGASEKKSLKSPGMRRPPRFRISLIVAGLIIMAGLLVIFLGGQSLHRSLSARKSEQATSSSSAPITTASATVSVANAYGTVLIKTEPPGAIVTLGDESKKSPATFNRIKVGSWPVKAEFDGYEPAEQHVAVEENQISDPGVIRLIRSTGTAQVSTSPEGSDFDLVDADGQHHTGKTPAELRDLPIGHGNIVFNREGIASHSQGIKVERNQVASIIWNTPVGSVSLATPPPAISSPPTHTRIPSSAERVTDADVREFLQRWQTAWTSSNLADYIQNYDVNFSGRNFSTAHGWKVLDRDRWLADKRTKFQRGEKISVQISNLQIVSRRSDSIEVTFDQTYSTSSYSDYGQKRIQFLVDSNGKLSILREDFVPSGGGAGFTGGSLNSETSSGSGLNGISSQSCADFIENWRQAWQSKDFSRYSSFYGAEFNGRNTSNGVVRRFDRREWMADKQAKFARNADLTIRVTDLQVTDDTTVPGAKIAVFWQTYQTGSYRDEGRKALRIGQDASGNLKILYEAFEQK